MEFLETQSIYVINYLEGLYNVPDRDPGGVFWEDLGVTVLGHTLHDGGASASLQLVLLFGFGAAPGVFTAGSRR